MQTAWSLIITSVAFGSRCGASYHLTNYVH